MFTALRSQKSKKIKLDDSVIVSVHSYGFASTLFHPGVCPGRLIYIDYIIF